MRRIRITGGRVIDPQSGTDGLFDVVVERGMIAAVLPAQGPDQPPPTFGNINSRSPADRLINASGKLITPGLIDMHTHLREPGHEYKETIETGCRAAAHGGFTAICCMPNTDPPNDNQSITDYILKRAKAARSVRVYPVGALTRGLAGEALADYGELGQAGCLALSDDGHPVMNAQVMRRALEYAKGFGLLVISHCEDWNLTADGVMNEGRMATRLGLAGIPNASEAVMVARDLLLSELTQVPIHIAHVSTKEAVHLIRDAKARGVCVTAETAPHYFTLTEEAVAGYDTNAKVNPPLRTAIDRDAVRQGLAEGTIDVIASDHAPHTSVEKDLEFDAAACGMIGLETSLPLSLALVEQGLISLSDLVMKMAVNPARILGLKKTGLVPGNPADITIIDPTAEIEIDAAKLQSKSRNTPFDGWHLRGKAVITMVGGKIVFGRP